MSKILSMLVLFIVPTYLNAQDLPKPEASCFSKTGDLVSQTSLPMYCIQYLKKIAPPERKSFLKNARGFDILAYKNQLLFINNTIVIDFSSQIVDIQSLLGTEAQLGGIDELYRIYPHEKNEKIFVLNHLERSVNEFLGSQRGNVAPLKTIKINSDAKIYPHFSVSTHGSHLLLHNAKQRSLLIYDLSKLNENEKVNYLISDLHPIQTWILPTSGPDLKTFYFREEEMQIVALSANEKNLISFSVEWGKSVMRIITQTKFTTPAKHFRLDPEAVVFFDASGKQLNSLP